MGNKMTDIKKAIAHFNYGIKCDIFQEPVTSYAKMAISALEKQIPKKVVEKKFVEDVSLNYCPCCNVRFIGWGMKHCGECGQALDWSDTE